MDLNYLLHRHQITLMQADAAASIEARCAHRGRAIGYAAEIARFRRDLDASLVEVI